MSDFIAQVKIGVIKLQGEKLIYIIGVTSPTKQKTGEYGCYVSLPNTNEAVACYGEDSMQVLSLAIQFIAQQIQEMLSQGWQFYDERFDNPFPLASYFGFTEFS